MIVFSKNKIKNNALLTVYYIFIFVVIFLISEYFLSLYIYGDQEHYTNFYYAVQGASLSEVPILQFAYTGSAEPFYGYLIWIFSNAGLDKIAIMSVFNGVFGVIVAATIRKLSGSSALAVFIFTNYYFIVLITAAERLKFSYMLLCLAILVGGRVGSVLFLFSPLVHLQSVLTIASIAFVKYLNLLQISGRSFSSHIKRIAGGSLSFAFLLIMFVWFQNRILAKFGSYSELGEGIFGVAEILILLFAALVISRRKFEAFIYFIPLIISAAILGGSRVNMVGFVILFYISLRDQKPYHPFLVALYLYFSYKSVGFINNIIEYGVGYVEST